MRRTKILATLGPACSSEETIYRLLTSGVDVFRLNFSHGTPEDRVKMIRIIRETATDIGRYVPIVGDIQGPKLRLGEVEGVQVLEPGQIFVITTRPVKGDAKRASTPFTRLPQEVEVGQRILINAGRHGGR
jgi:pyruvate kinase